MLVIYLPLNTRHVRTVTSLYEVVNMYGDKQKTIKYTAFMLALFEWKTNDEKNVLLKLEINELHLNI